jgi:hypothetical protein
MDEHILTHKKNSKEGRLLLPVIYLFGRYPPSLSEGPYFEGIAVCADDGEVLMTARMPSIHHMSQELVVEHKELYTRKYPGGYKIIECGFGEYPPTDVLDKMQQYVEQKRFV